MCFYNGNNKSLPPHVLAGEASSDMLISVHYDIPEWVATTTDGREVGELV